MPVFDENGKQITNNEEFPKMKDPEETGSFKPARKRFPILPAALGLIALIFVIVAIVYMVKASALEQEVAILNKAKAQLASAETKLQEMTKENNKARAELSQAKNEIDTLKAKNQALEDQLAKQKKAAAAATKKEAKPAPKKTPPKRP
ncbi:MAG: hypothetical protein PHT96_02330 [Syntrophorhabdaceae bacterium]|nr:hypothetical protein [Syntrophorhabdaceae bacterium]MDD4195233.1 hypothetical protein [Syntrophorhabdaceae bacterium]